MNTVLTSWSDLNLRQRYGSLLDTIESLEEPTLDNIRNDLQAKFSDYKMHWVSSAIKRLCLLKLITPEIHQQSTTQGQPSVRIVRFYRVIGPREVLML